MWTTYCGYIHKHSDYLIVIIWVGLAQACPNNILIIIMHVVHISHHSLDFNENISDSGWAHLTEGFVWCSELEELR